MGNIDRDNTEVRKLLGHMHIGRGGGGGHRSVNYLTEI